MGKFTPLDFNKYAALARQAAAEGCVLLKNENEALPLRKGDKVAVFGRIAFHYYKSGLGSGGLVNTKYVVGILDALKEEKDITLDENLLGTYEKWIEKNPYDEGQGWGKVPWSQKEMELTDEIVESAKGADAAIAVVAHAEIVKRKSGVPTAGEAELMLHGIAVRPFFLRQFHDQPVQIRPV